MSTTATEPAAPERTVFLGCVHLDPDGADRLGRALQGLSADAVTVEISPYAVDFRRRESTRLLALLDERLRSLTGRPPAFADGRFDAIRRQIELPYEYAVANAFGAARGVAVVPVDLSEISRELLPLIETELLDVDNLRSLLAGPPRDLRAEAASAYARVRLALDDPRATSWPKPYAAERRDPHIEAGIRRAIAETGARRLVHVCGAEHLLPYPGNPIDRLSAERETRVLLDKAGAR